MKITDIQSLEEKLAFLEKETNVFKDRAREHDEHGTFPFENFKELKEIGYPALTIPKSFGGSGISLYELVRLQETLGKADGSTALSIGWHMGITKNLGENDGWDDAVFSAFAKDVVKTGALINNTATEPATGSPTRGGKPETFAKKSGSSWVINGRKTFSTMSPILDYFVVSASIDGEDTVGNFLIRRSLKGVSVEETWDSIAMRASGSHDLVLEDVHVNEEDFLQTITPGNKPAAGWLLHIPACYLGIARAAQEEAIDFATTYSPGSMKGTISDIDSVRQRIGQMELLILQSQHLLYSVARKWDESSEEVRQTMKTDLGAAKLAVVNWAVEVVDLAMRIVGARSLSAKSPLQRYYRDVRAGLHNPPMDDMTVMQLASKSIEARVQ